MISRNWALLVIVSGLLGSACAKKNKAEDPPPPCATGINKEGTTCSTDLVGDSAWIRQYEVYADEVAAKKKSDPEKQVTIIQRFKRQRDGSKIWRRSITVESRDGLSQTMMIGGTVESIDKEKIILKINRSTCDNVDPSFYLDTTGARGTSRELFYQRYGTNLSVRTKPFPKIESSQTSSSSGLFGAIAEAMIVTPIKVAMETVMLGLVDGLTEIVTEMLTFGLLRDQLKMGVGDFHALNPIVQTKEARIDIDHGPLGCFVDKAVHSSGFKLSPEQSVSW